MKIVYFTESLYPHVDGVSRTLARLFRTLEEQAIDFRVFSPFLPPADISWRERVHPVGSIRFPLYRDYRVSSPRMGEITRLLDHFDPDLIHLVSPTPLAYRAQRLAQRRGIPVVASFHTHFVSYFRFYGIGWMEGFGWSLLRGFYRGCERVYAPSPSLVRELTSEGIENVELWSRGIDLTGFNPAHRDEAIRRRVGGDESTPVLLLVSRLVQEKDLADLVAVERWLRSRGVRFTLVLVGDGPMRRALERALPKAIFVGHADHDLSGWYASADVFVFPSTTETLGNVVLEALASGLPCVVVNRGGPQDLIMHGENGFIAEANDIESLGDHLRRLLEDPALRRRMSDQARQSAHSRSWDEINGGLLASYQAVLGSRPGCDRVSG